MTTHGANYRCTAKEYPSGRVFLALELMGGEPPAALTGIDIALDLRKGISVAQATAVATSLNKIMAGIAVTERAE